MSTKPAATIRMRARQPVKEDGAPFDFAYVDGGVYAHGDIATVWSTSEKYKRSPIQIAAQFAASDDLVKALINLLDKYTALVASGDAGNFDAESEPEVIASRAALAKAGAA